MARVKTKERMTIVEAVDFLSSVSEVDSRYMDHEGELLHPSRWVQEDRIAENEEILQSAFDTVRCYLEQMYQKHEKGQIDLAKDKGIHAIVEIVREAIVHLRQFTGLFQRGIHSKNLDEVKEYCELMECLQRKIYPFVHIKHEFIEEDDEEECLIEDLENIQEDRKYELFYMMQEDGTPYYSDACMRRLQRLYDFEKIEGEHDTYSKKIKILEAKDFQQRAIAILVGTDSLVREFYQIAFQEKENQWISSISKALMSLMLASTPQSIPSQGNIPKTAAEYFFDFRGYLREAIESQEYARAMCSNKNRAMDQKCLALTHKLCSCYFHSVSLKKDMAAFLIKIVGPTGSKPKETNALLQKEDHALRHIWRHRRHGPIKKLMEAFLRGDFERGWDPLADVNSPSSLFSFQIKNHEVQVCHMPCPVVQEYVKHAKVVQEFETFLHTLSEEKQKVLLIDVQDSLSEYEHARTEALQNLQETYGKHMSVMRLAKNTDFYLQQGIFQEEIEAKDFIQQLHMQLIAKGACGFTFPKTWDFSKLSSFIGALSDCIHEVFFSSRNKLSCRERQDFIDIFYPFLLLKTIELEQPDMIILISKDGLDAALCTAATLFFSAKMVFVDHVLQKEDTEFLFWVLYAPVLMLRERMTHQEETDRVLHFMQRMEEGWKKNHDILVMYIRKLYAKGWMQQVRIN